MDLSKYNKFVEDAPPSMSRFQIERFLIGTQPPTERYFICCTELRARISTAKALQAKIKSKIPETEQAIYQRQLDDIQREIVIFGELAERWYPITKGRSYEDLQQTIWDERLSYRLCQMAMTESSIQSMLPDIMAMPEGSNCRRLLIFLLSGSRQDEGHQTKIHQEIEMTLASFDVGPKTIGVDDERQD